MALNFLGIASTGISHFEKALEYYEQSLAIAREVHNRADEGAALNSLGGVYTNLAQYEKARAYHEQALTIAREVKNRLAEAGSLSSLWTSVLEPQSI